MKLAIVVLLSALGLSTARASGYVGVYALIDKVEMEPNADQPDRVRISGVFSVAKDRGTFQAPQRGYLYFNLSGDNLSGANKDLVRREWADLKAAAGTHTVIAFGGSSFTGFTGSFSTVPRIRKTDEKPDSPDPYVLGAGLSKIRPDTDYGPVKALLEFR